MEAVDSKLYVRKHWSYGCVTAGNDSVEIIIPSLAPVLRIIMFIIVSERIYYSHGVRLLVYVSLELHK